MRGFLHFAPKCPYLKLRGGPVKKANCIICNIRKMKKRIKENVAKLWPWIPWFPIFLISLSCLCHWQEGSWAGTKDSRGRTSYPVRGSSTLLLSGVLQRYNVLDISKLVHLYTQILCSCHMFGVEKGIISIKRAKMCTNIHLLNY